MTDLVRETKVNLKISHLSIMLEYAGATNQESKTRTGKCDGKTTGLGTSSMRWATRVEVFIRQLNVHSK